MKMPSIKLNWILVSWVALATLSAACREEAPPSPAAPGAKTETAPPPPKTFLVNGVLRRIDWEEGTATIKHEEIPNYMAAMTMPFTVRNTNELAGLQPGDAVVFRLNVTENDSWIDKLKKSSTPPPPEPPKREPVRLVRDVEELQVGDPLPNYRFTNELGQAIQLADFKGKSLALTFIYTRCPLPDFCPLMSRNFGQVYKLLTSRPNAPANWHLLSISFDPHHDTPAVMKAYASAYQYDPAKWNFVTGAMIDIDAITDQFNLAIAVQNDQWDHRLRTVVIDAAGRVHKIFVGNQWKAEELADEIIAAAKVLETGQPETSSPQQRSGSDGAAQPR
jgi:protein SCO1/2